MAIKTVRRGAAAKKTVAKKRGRPAAEEKKSRGRPATKVAAKRGRPAGRKAAQQQAPAKRKAAAKKQQAPAKRTRKAAAAEGQWQVNVAIRALRVFENGSATVEEAGDNGYLVSADGKQFNISRSDLLVMTPTTVVARIPVNLSYETTSVEQNDKGVVFAVDEDTAFARFTDDVLVTVSAGGGEEAEDEDEDEAEEGEDDGEDFEDGEEEEEEDDGEEEEDDGEEEEEEDDGEDWDEE